LVDGERVSQSKAAAEQGAVSTEDLHHQYENIEIKCRKV
jgi:hypothetical protein